MGWFSIAVIVGFLLFWSWRKHLQAGPAKTPAPPEAAKKPDGTNSDDGSSDLAKKLGARLAKVSSCLVRLTHYVLIEYLPATIAGLTAVAFVLWILGQYFVSIDGFNIRIIEDIRRGYITRFILGLILGFGVGYVLEQRSRAAEEKPSGTMPASPPSNGDIIAQRHADTRPDEEKDEPASPLSSLARLGTNTLLSIGIGMFILALASPHLDGWLNHVTKIKLPYGELTVATSTTHRTINSDALFYLADALSLTQLSSYHDKLDQDIAYIEKFQIPEMKANEAIRKQAYGDEDTSNVEDKRKKLSDALDKAKKLKPVFDHVISPIAHCLLDAIDKGMSVERVRRKLRTATESLEEIILAGDRLSDEEMNQAHAKFWSEIEALPEFVQNYLDKEKATDTSTKDTKTKDTAAQNKDTAHLKECRSYLKADTAPLPIQYRPIPIQYSTPAEDMAPAEPKNLRDIRNLPRMKDYKDVPYLGVAAFLFSAFVRDEELGQKIFEKISGDLQYKDKGFLYNESYIGYYKGLPTGTAISYLEEMLKDAREHREVLERAKRVHEKQTYDPTQPAKRDSFLEQTRLIDTLLKREQETELRAVNDLAYYIGDSIARGIPSAMSYRGRAEDYVNELYRSLDKEEDVENRNEFLDTYAYVSIVLESRKAVPDPDKFRRMLATLEKAAEYFEDKTPKTDKLEDATARANLAVVRAHLAAARELAEE